MGLVQGRGITFGASLSIAEVIRQINELLEICTSHALDVRHDIEPGISGAALAAKTKTGRPYLTHMSRIITSHPFLASRV